jgi:hypothetical protein
MGSPRAFFFETCERSVEEVSAWRFKDFRGQGLGLREEPVDVDDHLCDCFRYVATCYPEASPVPKKLKPPPTVAEWRAARVKRLYREAVRRAQSRYQDDSEDYV